MICALVRLLDEGGPMKYTDQLRQRADTVGGKQPEVYSDTYNDGYASALRDVADELEEITRRHQEEEK